MGGTSPRNAAENAVPQKMSFFCIRNFVSSNYGVITVYSKNTVNGYNHWVIITKRSPNLLLTVPCYDLSTTASSNWLVNYKWQEVVCTDIHTGNTIQCLENDAGH